MAAAEHVLEEYVFPSVYQTFQDVQLRQLAHFEKLPTSEHDRIFNELLVAGIISVENYLDAQKEHVRDGDFHFWRNVLEELPRQYTKKMISLGVDSGNAKLMRQLVEMRYTEYEELADEVWQASNGASKEFRDLEPEQKRLASMIQGIAIGTASHIFRGKLQDGDPLTQYLAAWNLQLQRKVGKFTRNL